MRTPQINASIVLRPPFLAAVLAIVLPAVLVLGGCIPSMHTPISRQTGPFTPTQPGYALQGQVVSRDGQPLMRVVQTDVDRYTTHYLVEAADGSPQASVSFGSSYNNTLDCRAGFPSLGVHYEARHPIVSFNQLLASYIDNGVLVDGRANEAGLQAYTASRGIQIVNTAAQHQRLREHGQNAMCQNCVEDFRRCQVEASARRANPPPGVSHSESCGTQYQECSQGGILTRQDEWPCGPPPAP